MRARDVRAIAFSAGTAAVILLATFVLFRHFLGSLAITAAWLAFVLTRPRMVRVIRRLRGDPDWSAYFKND